MFPPLSMTTALGNKTMIFCYDVFSKKNVKEANNRGGSFDLKDKFYAGFAHRKRRLLGHSGNGLIGSPKIGLLGLSNKG